MAVMLTLGDLYTSHALGPAVAQQHPELYPPLARLKAFATLSATVPHPLHGTAPANPARSMDAAMDVDATDRSTVLRGSGVPDSGTDGVAVAGALDLPDLLQLYDRLHTLSGELQERVLGIHRHTLLTSYRATHQYHPPPPVQYERLSGHEGMGDPRVSSMLASARDVFTAGTIFTGLVW